MRVDQLLLQTIRLKTLLKVEVLRLYTEQLQLLRLIRRSQQQQLEQHQRLEVLVQAEQQHLILVQLLQLVEIQVNQEVQLQFI